MAEKEKLQLTVKGVLADMEAGLDRKALKAKYGLSHTDMGRLFAHPALKNKKQKKEQGFVLVDDTDTVVEDNEGEDANAAISEDTKKAEETPLATTATADVSDKW